MTLVDCLDAFAKEEKLGEDELWYCSRCQTHRAAAKKLDVWALPPFLVIHLKRFHMHNGRWIKSSTNVSFPQEGLEPSRFALGSGAGRAASDEGAMSPAQAQAAESKSAAPEAPGEAVEAAAASGAAAAEEENAQLLTEATHGAEVAPAEGGKESGGARDDSSAAEGLALSQPHCGESPAFNVEQAGRHYDLYALVCHQGILGGGHYIAYARTSADEWYCYNDSACRKVRKWLRGSIETKPRVRPSAPSSLIYFDNVIIRPGVAGGCCQAGQRSVYTLLQMSRARWVGIGQGCIAVTTCEVVCPACSYAIRLI